VRKVTGGLKGGGAQTWKVRKPHKDEKGKDDAILFWECFKGRREKREGKGVSFRKSLLNELLRK